VRLLVVVAASLKVAVRAALVWHLIQTKTIFRNVDTSIDHQKFSSIDHRFQTGSKGKLF
jgi:hypothetical protein